MSSPPATVIVPLLRQDDGWLSTCIASALAQTVPCEVLVVTDQRTPRSNHDVLARHACARLRVIERPAHARFAGGLNLAIASARADRVCFVLSDDWLVPQAVELCLSRAADLVSAQAESYAADGRTRIATGDRRRTAAGYAACADDEARARYLGHFMLLARDVVQAAGGLDETVGDAPGVDDYHLPWTLLEHGASVDIVERVAYAIRDHAGERLTNRRPLQMWATMREILSRHGLTGDALEQRLLWHTRWFGRPMHESTDAQIQRMQWAPAPTAPAPTDPQLDPRLTACIDAIRSPATLEVHARRIARSHGSPISWVLAALTEAATRGLLVPARSDARASAPRGGSEPAPPSTIGIVTCDDPESAATALAELRAHVGEHPARFVVCDDGRGAPVRHDGAVHLARVEKQAAAARIAARTGVARELLAFALADPLDSRYTLGANLNALLLAGTGEVLLSVDDDVRPRSFVAGPLDAPVAVVTGTPAIERWFVADEETARWRRQIDLVALLGRWIGRDAPELGPGKRVIAAWVGVCGTTGFANPTARVLASDDDRLRHDDARLRAVLAAPRALRCPTRPTLNRGAGFTSSTIAIDHRELLPPFFPIGRGIDHLWGATAAACRPEAAFVHLPVGLAHDRPTAARGSSVDLPLWFVIADAIDRAGCGLVVGGVAARMDAIGRALVRFASAPAILHDRVAELRQACLSQERNAWERRLDHTPHAGGLWRALVQRRIAEIDAAPPAVPPVGLALVMQRYGELLSAWPEIVAARGFAA